MWGREAVGEVLGFLTGETYLMWLHLFLLAGTRYHQDCYKPSL